MNYLRNFNLILTARDPQVFHVNFLPTGFFAPGRQYRFSEDEDGGRRKR